VAHPVSAQSSSASNLAPGSLSIRLTDLRSLPLAGVSVFLRNQTTGVLVRATGAHNGIFLFTRLEPGVYAIEAENAELGHGSLQDIQISAGHESRVQASMEFSSSSGTAPAPAAPVVALNFTTPAIPVDLVAESPVLAAALEPAPLLRQSFGASYSLEPLPLTESVVLEATLAPAPLFRQTLASHSLEPLPKTESVLLAVLLTSRPFESLSLPALSLSAPPLNPLTAPAPSAMASAAEPAPGAASAVMLSAVQQVQQASKAFAPAPAIQSATRPLDPAAAALTTTIAIDSLPASGRRWQEFVFDTPATSAQAGSSQPVLGGSAQNAPDTTIDGMSTRLAFGAASGSPPLPASHDESGNEQSLTPEGWNGGRGLSVSQAAIRQVETVAGDAETSKSRFGGGLVSVETRSGEEGYHGQAFLYDRQNTWGAQNPFTQWVRNTGTAANPVFAAVPYTPPDHEVVSGLGLGSHLRRNLPGLRNGLFWFAALDRYSRNDPGLATVRNPSEFFAALEPTSPAIQLLGAQLGESSTQAWSDYLGVPRAGLAPLGLEQLDVLLGPAARSSSQWVGFARLDWTAGERHRFTLEGIRSRWNSPGGGITSLSENYGSHSFGTSEAGQQSILARWQSYLNANLLAVIQASLGRSILSARPGAPSALERQFLTPDSQGQLPQIVVDSRYGFTIGNPSRFGSGSYPDERLYHLEQMFDWVRGSLLVRSGFELGHDVDRTTLLRNQSGTYSYSKVEDFIADALAYQAFGLNASGWDVNTQQFDQHNCNPAGNGLGALPCYSYYSQTMGPSGWHLSTNDWAAFVTAQWQPFRFMVLSTGLRWEREQMPPAIAALSNPQLPLTQKLPGLGNGWGPRLALALGSGESRWPVLRLGYGVYSGRTENATIESALTQTGSFNGDLNFFIRPTDGYTSINGASAAPPFPYVLTGQPSSVVKPGAVEFAPNFRNPQIHQALASLEESLAAHISLTASALVSLGRRLPISIDTNFDPAANPGTITYNVKDPTGKGPIRAAQITVPFYASWPGSAGTCPYYTPAQGDLLPGRPCPDYQQIAEIMGRANSTYEAAMVRLTRTTSRGLSLRAHYTYAHAMDWNPNETTLVSGSDVLDPADFNYEYGTSNLDVRHAAALTAVYETPWKLRRTEGRFASSPVIKSLAKSWALSTVGQYRSGLPYTMRVSSSVPKEFTSSGAAIVGLGPGMNGSGGDNRIYGLGNDGVSYNIGRNTFRYPATWKLDLRLAKSFDLGGLRQLQLLGETFNLFNHQNVTRIETTGYSIEAGSTSGSLPTLCFLTLNPTTGSGSCSSSNSSGTPVPAFGQPLNINATDYYRERQFQLGLRMRF
jgi:hypothetical protein